MSVTSRRLVVVVVLRVCVSVSVCECLSRNAASGVKRSTANHSAKSHRESVMKDSSASLEKKCLELTHTAGE